ncbi:MAG: helix-turn-helix domain-containing protein [Caulobacterales bacterium]|nr:helix-turn-helix domain-containing protein [Caulobacterales bacterium]
MSITATARTASAAIDAIERLGVRETFAKDEEIYGQAEPVQRVYRVIHGAVRTTRLLSDGRRQVGEFYFPGDVFGLETGPDHRYSAEALCDCEVLSMKRSAVREDVAAADLQRMIWDATIRELDRTQEHVLMLGRKTACERVASFLLDIVGRNGGAGDLPMSRQDMADYLGLTIETVSRMLSQLQSSAVVEFDALRHFRIRNPQAIARLAA